MIKTAAEIAKLTREFLKRQATKPATNVQGFMKGFYGGPVKKTAAIGKQAIASPLRTVRQQITPRLAEGFKQFGASSTQIDDINRIFQNLENLTRDPKLWNAAKKIPTTKGKTIVNELTKELWSVPLFIRGNINRSGLSVMDDTFIKLVEKEGWGKTMALHDVVNKGILDKKMIKSVLKSQNIHNIPDEQITAFIMDQRALNGLHRDIQFSDQFRTIAGSLRKDGNITLQFKEGRSRADDFIETIRAGIKKHNRNKNFKFEKLNDNEVIMSFSPQSKSNFFTGGIGAKVYWNANSPTQLGLIPHDLYDIGGRTFRTVTKKLLGMPQEQLNLMGMRKITIPKVDISRQSANLHWKNRKTGYEGVKDLEKKFKVKKAFTGRVKPTTQSSEDLHLVTKGKITKKQISALKESVERFENVNVPTSRYIKTGAAIGIPSAITAGWFMGDDDE